ncbi:MAG: hypothetical protein ACK56S_14450 [Planctomycetota bacterium]
MPRRSHCLSALLALAVAAPAQEGAAAAVERRATFVRVEAADGAPLAGATVTFAGHVPHLAGLGGATDVQRAQADGRGRAQAKLLPGLCYVAWAVGPADGDGRAAFSQPAAWFAAGGVQTLRAVQQAVRRSVRIEGAAAWAHRGPLRFVQVTAIPGTEDELVPGDDGAYALPPGPSGWIEARTADGAPLWLGYPRELVLTVPPPRPLRVLAKDDKGAPVAGAVVRLRVGQRSPWQLDGFGGVAEHRWRDLGTTGADGALAAEVPYAADPLQDPKQGDLLLFVGAPGRPAVVGGIANGEFYVDDHKASPPAGDALVFTLRTAPPLVGSLGKLQPGTEVRLGAVCKLHLDRGSYRHDTRGFRATVAADGSFTFDDVPAEVHALRLCVVPPACHGPAPLFPPQFARELPSEVAPASGGAVKALALAELTLRVTDARGGPARGLVATVLPVARGASGFREGAAAVPLDTKGEAGLRVVPGKWLVIAVSPDGYCAEAFEWGAGRGEVALALREPARMRLLLKGADGAPVAGAKVGTRGTSTRGTGDPLQSALQNLRTFSGRQWNDLRTDAAGRVELPFVPVEGVTVKVALTWDGGESEDVVLEAGDDWVEVRPK